LRGNDNKSLLKSKRFLATDYTKLLAESRFGGTDDTDSLCLARQLYCRVIASEAKQSLLKSAIDALRHPRVLLQWLGTGNPIQIYNPRSAIEKPASENTLSAIRSTPVLSKVEGLNADYSFDSF
jgi:hypothetical protein